VESNVDISLLNPAGIRDPFGMQTNHSETTRAVCQKRLASARKTSYQVCATKVYPGGLVGLLFSLLLLEVLICSSAAAQTMPVSNSQLAATELNARVEALLSQMTVDEKVGQLVQYVPGDASGPDGSKLSFDDLIAKGQVGSMMYLVDANRINHYQHIAMEKSRLHIPLIFAMDVIHGHRTTFPAPLALAATWDPSVAERVAHFWCCRSTRGRHHLGLLANG
jgi:Glycosyl hydrolase family 3 N terminal domain